MGTVHGLQIAGGSGTITGTTADDQIAGGPGNEVIHGGAGYDWLQGVAGADQLFGDDGSDVLDGGPGNDILVGGAGIDIAVYSGLRSDYQIVPQPDGSFVIVDMRSGSPDGTDQVSDVELFQFADFTVNPAPSPPAGTTADMILHRADGTYEIYNVGSNAILAGYSLGQIGSEWQFAGLGRFFGTDSSDMMLRNSATGAFQVYDVDRNNITITEFLGQVGLEWNIAGFGHFMAGGGETDMMLTYSNNAVTSFEAYGISDNKITTAGLFGRVGTEWQVAGFGPGNGTTDMVAKRVDPNNVIPMAFITTSRTINSMISAS